MIMKLSIYTPFKRWQPRRLIVDRSPVRYVWELLSAAKSLEPFKSDPDPFLDYDPIDRFRARRQPTLEVFRRAHSSSNETKV